MVTAIVLAGGRSKRFEGADKAFATLDETSLLEHVLSGVQSVADSVVVSCRREQLDRVRTHLEGRPIDGNPLVDDRLVGPLGGLDDGLSVSSSTWSLVVGCDFPLVDERLFDALQPRDRADAVVPNVDGRVQPLCAYYRTDVAHDAVLSALEDGTRRANDLPKRLDSVLVDVAELPFDARRRLWNVNTRADLDRLNSQAKSGVRGYP